VQVRLVVVVVEALVERVRLPDLRMIREPPVVLEEHIRFLE
jgi:hypothetical protein